MLLLAAGFGPATLAQAQQYPAQDIHFICAFPPGSGADVLVRYFADKVRPLTGRNVIVENRSGAGGNIAIEYVSRAKPDGYTVFVHGASGTAASMSLFKSPPVDVAKTIQVVATINRQPFMVLVDAKSPHRTLADLTAAMKPKGNKASYATAAPFGTVVGEVYKLGTGVQAVEVPYKNAIDSLNDQLSGAIDYAVHDPVYALAEQRKGDLRILAVSTAERLKANPDLPTLKELGVSDLNMMGWWAAMVPQGTPKAVDRSDQQMVRSGGRVGGDRQVSGELRRRSADDAARQGTGVVPERDQQLGRIREDRQNRACRVKQADAGGPVAMVPHVATSTERKSR